MSSGADVIGADVTLQIGGVAEYFGAVLAGVAASEAVLEDRVPSDQRPAAVPLGAQRALVPPQRKLVAAHQVVIHSAQFIIKSIQLQSITMTSNDIK